MARPGPAGSTVPQARFLTLLHCAAAAETEQNFMRSFHTLPPWQHRIKSCSVPSPGNRRRPGVVFLIGEPQRLASLRAAPPGLPVLVADPWAFGPARASPLVGLRTARLQRTRPPPFAESPVFTLVSKNSLRESHTRRDLNAAKVRIPPESVVANGITRHAPTSFQGTVTQTAVLSSVTAGPHPVAVQASTSAPASRHPS